MVLPWHESPRACMGVARFEPGIRCQNTEDTANDLTYSETIRWSLGSKVKQVDVPGDVPFTSPKAPVPSINLSRTYDGQRWPILFLEDMYN